MFCSLPPLRFSLGPGGLLTQRPVSYAPLQGHIPLEKQQRKSSRTGAIQKGVDDITADRGVQWFALKPLTAVITASFPTLAAVQAPWLPHSGASPCLLPPGPDCPWEVLLVSILQDPVICGVVVS